MEKRSFRAHIHDHSGTNAKTDTNNRIDFHYKLLNNDEILPRSFQFMDNKMSSRYLQDLFPCSMEIIDKNRNDTRL